MRYQLWYRMKDPQAMYPGWRPCSVLVQPCRVQATKILLRFIRNQGCLADYEIREIE